MSWMPGLLLLHSMHFLVTSLKLSGGVLIGAGHHGEGWNAVVPLNSYGAYFNEVQTQTLLDIYHSRLYKKASYDQIGKVAHVDLSCVDKYIAKVTSQIDVKEIRASKFKVVVDFCNGSGGLIGQRLSEVLGLEMTAINMEQSGILPHDPEPRPRTSRQVKALITPLEADIGFVLNSDVSRITLVTNTGELPSEETVYAIVANHILSASKPSDRFVTNVRSTRMLDDIAKKHHVILEKTSIGQAMIVDRMLETGAKIGGDGDGSVVFGNGINGYDGFNVLCTMLEAMAQKKLTSNELVGELPFYYIVKSTVRYRTSPFQVLKQIKPYFSDAVKCDETDGLRFDWDDGWVHLRVSLTEPILRVIAEWKTKAGANDLADRAIAIIERQAAHA